MTSITEGNNTYLGSNNRSSVFDFTASDHPGKDIVIFAHGYKGFKDWGAWDLVGKAFADAGLHFLKFNFSHNGGTVENPIDFPDLEAFSKNTYSRELEDLDRVISLCSDGFSHAGKMLTFDRIFLIGHSRGGGIAILKTARDKRIDKLATWAAVSDFGERFEVNIERWEKEGVTYVENSRTRQLMPHKFIFYTDFVKNRDKLDIGSAAEEIDCPWLIVHGDDDASVPLTHADRLMARSTRADLYIVKNTGHTFGANHPWEKNQLPGPLAKVVDKSIAFFKNCE